MEEDIINQIILPNETPLSKLPLKKRVLVITNRRFLVLKEGKRKAITLSQAVPLGIIDELEFGNGCLLTLRVKPKIGTSPLEIHYDVSESPDEFINHFRSLKEDMWGDNSHLKRAKKLSLKYLERMPISLTYNAILDLNAVLQDRPYPDRLYHHGEKFLGSEPFILEESLMDFHNPKNGVLFAAGRTGYIWINGEKKGRYMRDVLVDMIAWKDIQCMSYHLTSKNHRITIVHKRRAAREPVISDYVWRPRLTQLLDEFSWLTQAANGPWIIADLMLKYSDFLMPICIDNDSNQYY